MKKKILFILKRKKPVVASFLRRLPFSFAVIRIPKKRILVNDTLSYFKNKDKRTDFFIFEDSAVIEINPAVYLNMIAATGKSHYKPDDFFMSLSQARYYHPFSSVISKEGYQIALVSNNKVNTQKEHTLFQELYIPGATKFQHIGMLLSTSDDNNYYHCLFQIAPKIWTLEKYGYDISKIDHFFLELSNLPFQKEILSTLNINSNKIVDLASYKHIEAEQLLLTPAFEKPEPWICERIRLLFLHSMVRNQNSPKKIYLSRKWARFRKLLNEKEFIGFISKFGFDIVCTEGMSIQQQATLFHGAEIIIAPHGAGLANIVFCKPDAVIIELRAKSHTGELATVYEHLSGILHLNHYTYVCDEYINAFGKRAIYLDLSVSIPEFEQLYLPVLAAQVNKVVQ
ncbi:MAG: glycosyltransferase 61 family protein [Bacteroidota bacterium]